MHRLFILLITLLPVALSSCGSPRSVSSFYHENKRKAGVRNMTIPGWALYLGTGIAHDIVKEEDALLALRLGKKIKKLQFMYSETAESISSTDVQHFIAEARNDNYEDLILVRDGETTVNIMVVEKKEKLRHLLILINDEADFVFLNMRSNIKIKDISKVINHYMSKKGWTDGEEAEEQKKKEKIPQA